MTNRSYYPPDLSNVLLERWCEAGLDPAALPNKTDLEMLIDTAYQASLLREENYVVQFDELSEFTPHQVRKIAAAFGYYRAIIGVHFAPEKAGKSTIWGMIVTGTSWVNHTENTVHDDASLPSKLVIHILGAGHSVFASGLKRVLEAISGQVLTGGFDPFRSNWLPLHFEPFRATLLNKLDIGSLLDQRVKLCDSFVRDVAQSVVRRVLSLVRGRGHGGMLIYLTNANDRRLDKWLRIRMRFKNLEATYRFQQLMLRLMQLALEVGVENGIAKVRWKGFLQMHDASLGKLHDSLVEFSHFFADLMSVDGALVLSRDFQLIGFGGEILGDSHVSCIERAIDLEAQNSITEPADASGTRHRSAYRLVSSVQDAIVVVVSQDGAVRFVAHRGGRLVYWPYLP